MTVVEAYDALKAADSTEPHSSRLRSALLDAVIELEHRVAALEAELHELRAEPRT